MEPENIPCPVCGNTRFTVYLESKDHFLTGQSFSIYRCEDCGLLFTRPAPGPNEIGRYYESKDYLAHDASQNNLITTLYRGARWFALRSKYRMIRSFVPGNRILDIGCGTGEFLGFCKRKGYEVEGIEPNPGARETAAQRYKIPVRERFSFSPEEQNLYDGVTLWHVLEHMHDPAETMVKIKSVLKPGGTLLIALPNPDSWDARHYSGYWGAYDLPRHLFHFRPPTFRRLSENYNFLLIKTVPQNLDAFYVSLLSERYKNSSIKLPKAFLSGVYSNLMGRRTGFGYSSQVYILNNKKS